jgi:hypothetical protein
MTHTSGAMTFAEMSPITLRWLLRNGRGSARVAAQAELERRGLR